VRRAAGRLAAVTALLAALVVCGALLLGCARTADSAPIRSHVPGIELVHTPGQEAAWSPDGRLIAFHQGPWIEFERPDGTPAGKIKAPPLDWEFSEATPIRFSADGRRLFYVTIAGPGRGDAVKATQVRRAGGVVQTSLGTRYADANFSAHGWPLVYVTGPYEFGLDGDRHGPPAALWKLGGPDAKPQRLMTVDGIPEEPVVGHHLVLFKQWLHKRKELWSVGLDGSDPHRIARFAYLHRYAFAPRGNDIAFTATRHGGSLGYALYLLDGSHGRPQRVGHAEVDDGPVWSPDGRWLVFSTPDGKIERIHPDGSGEETISEADGEEVEWLAFSPDGRRLLYGAHPPPTDSLGYGGGGD
jgi:WD40 repeat protein